MGLDGSWVGFGGAEALNAGSELASSLVPAGMMLTPALRPEQAVSARRAAKTRRHLEGKSETRPVLADRSRFEALETFLLRLWRRKSQA